MSGEVGRRFAENRRAIAQRVIATAITVTMFERGQLAAKAPPSTRESAPRRWMLGCEARDEAKRLSGNEILKGSGLGLGSSVGRARPW